MINNVVFKKKLVDKCVQIIEEKLVNIDAELALIQQSANEETKSSAGDKYETSRSMLMLEKEKFLGQKDQLFQQLKPLKTININRDVKKVELGAIVFTSNGNYFISSSIGQININNDVFFAISALAPIAQNMLNKTIGDDFVFNKNQLRIVNIF